MHQAGHRLGRIGVAVVLDALDQRAGAVAHAGDGHADRAHGDRMSLRVLELGGVVAPTCGRRRRCRLGGAGSPAAAPGAARPRSAGRARRCRARWPRCCARPASGRRRRGRSPAARGRSVGQPLGSAGPGGARAGRGGPGGPGGGRRPGAGRSCGRRRCRPALRAEELVEQQPALVGDPVDLARPLGAAGRRRPPGPQAGPLAAERAGRRGSAPTVGSATALDGHRPGRSSRERAG